MTNPAIPTLNASRIALDRAEPPDGTPRFAVRGVAIATSAASAYSAIPNTSTGVPPSAVRLSATAACYVRMGKPVEAAAVDAVAGTGYLVGDSLAVVGGTASMAMTLAVTHTKVVSATVAAGGAGTLGNGAGVIVEGTTGTGTKFRASVTIAANAIASVQSISLVGDYTANITDAAHEPVTYISGAASGTTLTGATLAVVSGVLTASVTNPGAYTVDPTNPVATTGGGDNAATFNVAMIASAAAGDLMITPECPMIVDAHGFDHVAALRVTADGVLQVAPIENRIDND